MKGQSLKLRLRECNSVEFSRRRLRDRQVIGAIMCFQGAQMLKGRQCNTRR